MSAIFYVFLFASVSHIAVSLLFPKGQVVSFWYKNKISLNEGDTSECSSSINSTNIFNDIKMKMLEIKATSMTADGSAVDYPTVKKSASFAQYVDLVKELKAVDLAQLSASAKKAALINIYNSLIVHAILEGLLDLNGGTVARLKLYASASYQIGQYLFSLNEIENGLLRLNRKSAVPMTFRPFRKENDPRRKLMMDELDPRIHFALNCGAKSCPPIGVYSPDPEELDEQLALATESFLDDSVFFDATTKTITLSMLFNWYKNDFGNNDEEVIEWVKTHASPELRGKLQTFQNSLKGDQPKISFSAYDWNLNSL